MRIGHFAELARKHESHFQSELVQRARMLAADFLILQHRNPAEAGTPDISLTGLGHTGWYELKVSRKPPVIRSRGVQDVTLARLAARGLARYIILTENGLFIDTVSRVQDGTWYEPSRLFVEYDQLFRHIRLLHKGLS